MCKEACDWKHWESLCFQSHASLDRQSFVLTVNTGWRARVKYIVKAELYWINIKMWGQMFNWVEQMLKKQSKNKMETNNVTYGNGSVSTAHSFLFSWWGPRWPAVLKLIFCYPNNCYCENIYILNFLNWVFEEETRNIVVQVTYHC